MGFIKNFAAMRAAMAAVLAAAAILTACAGSAASPEQAPAGVDPFAPAFALVVPSPQQTVYNGAPQPLSFHYEGDAEPEVVYYPSAEARDEDREGSRAAPVEAGSYYARVIRPPEKGFASREEIFADYRILKRPVTIAAEENQEAFYNGDPKRVRADIEAPVPALYSYYPNFELMAAAVAAASAEEAVPGEEKFAGRRMETFRGYRRVDRAPIEQGEYYVWIYCPGDENHEKAEAFVRFTIHPPRGR